MKRTLTLIIFAFYTFATLCSAEDWPFLRGPNTSGIAEGATPPLTWSDTKNIKWKTPIPGKGHSSPVIMGKHVYLTTAIEENVSKKRYLNNTAFHADRITLKALCISMADGKIKWETELFKIEKPTPVHTLNSFATPTPSVDNKNLYCDFGEFGTACVNTKKGDVVWKKKLPLDHEVGPGSSTIIYKDLLILLRDGRDKQYITALRKKDGEEAWKTDRPPVTSSKTDFHKSFSSPIIFETEGNTQLFAPCAQWAVSYNPTTGKEHWRFKHGAGFSLAAQPSVGNGMVYFCSGFAGNHVVAIRHNGSGDVSKTHLAWQTRKFAPTIPSPALLKDRLYWIQDSGSACVVNALTGELVWKKKLPGKYLAAPIVADNKIYFINQKGLTTILEAGDVYKPLATNTLSELEVIATPAFVGKSIILRTDKHLYRIEE